MPQNEEKSTFTTTYNNYRQRAISPPVEFETSEMPFCEINEEKAGIGGIPWLYVAAGVAGGLVLRSLISRNITISK